jgi:hypothetical protein
MKRGLDKNFAQVRAFPDWELAAVECSLVTYGKLHFSKNGCKEPLYLQKLHVPVPS